MKNAYISNIREKRLICIRNAKVGSSILLRSTNKNKALG